MSPCGRYDSLALAELDGLVHHNQRLAVIATREQQIERLGSVFEAVYKVLLVVQGTRENHGGQFELRFSRTAHVVQHNEALHATASHNQHGVVLEAGKATHVVVLRNGAAEHHATTHRNVHQNCIEYLTTDIVEVDINAARTGLTNTTGEVWLAVVQALVKAVELNDFGTLFRPPARPTTFCTLALAIWPATDP